MSSKLIISVTIIVLSVSNPAFADRQLDKSETLQIFQTLTNQPKKTWISAGTIEATHTEYRAPKTTNSAEINNQINKEIKEYQNNTNKRELTQELQKMKLDAIPFNVRYRLSNEYVMNSKEIIRFEGDKFYWEINVISRADSIKLPADLEGNFMTEEFNLSWNKSRSFTWDGDKYTISLLSMNYAIVDSTGSTPHVVNGVLTAGIIPWGYGDYTYNQLSAAEFSAEERDINKQTQVHLTFNTSDGTKIICVLAPEMNYAALSCSIDKPSDSVIQQRYSGYRLISGQWIPATISIEQYDSRSNKLLASDLWNLTKISDATPAVSSFIAEYQHDASIEYSSSVTDKPVMYRYSNIADVDLLLGEKLAYAASEGSQPQNCATAALKYTISRFGKTVNDRQLAQLVSNADGTTNLYAMKQFVQGLGLYSRVVQTDLAALKNLSGCKAILHIPGKNHFVVLDQIDDKSVWLVDLSSNQFYYHTDINVFGMDWTEGIALLISDKPIKLQNGFIEIADNQLRNIIGASGYTCTYLYQEYDVVYCGYLAGECFGYYEQYFERWGCEYATSGSCTNSKMLRMIESPCINSPYDPESCTVTGTWYGSFMLACQ
ncbi:MAG: hypothetical protein A2167_06530 [Planctomycetes bacterium RBG_13_46_10]|nr:MAG: hypothetical protein A2167_06530 [Planctomycetes bacterium RBG_13_46_10]